MLIYLCENDHTIEEKISTITNMINTINRKKENWIEKCGFTISDADSIDDPIKYNDNEYLSSSSSSSTTD